MSVAIKCDRCQKYTQAKGNEPTHRGLEYGNTWQRVPSLVHYDINSDTRTSWDLCKDCFAEFELWVNHPFPPIPSTAPKSTFCPECKVDLRFAYHRDTCSAKKL